MRKQEFYSILENTEKGREYLNLISQAESRKNTNSLVFEKHHIHPKGLGGPNTDENIVKLTVFEHCLAHLFLVQAIPCSQTLKPIQRMSRQFLTLEGYQKVTLEDTYHWSEWREKAIHCTHSPEHLAAISRARKGQKSNSAGTVWMSKEDKNRRVGINQVSTYQSEGWTLGRKQESKENISKACKGRISPNLGKKMSEGMKEKMRIARVGTMYVNKDGRSYQTKDPVELEKLLAEGWVRGRGKLNR